MPDLRSNLIRIASELPKGDPTRRELLATLSVRTAKMNARLFPANSYLNQFFSEKDIPSKVFDVKDSQGVSHSIPNEVVVEFIAKTKGSELRKIEDTIRKIDFKNGDVNHFFAHLAKAIAEMYAGAVSGGLR